MQTTYDLNKKILMAFLKKHNCYQFVRYLAQTMQFNKLITHEEHMFIALANEPEEALCRLKEDYNHKTLGTINAKRYILQLLDFLWFLIVKEHEYGRKIESIKPSYSDVITRLINANDVDTWSVNDRTIIANLKNDLKRYTL